MNNISHPSIFQSLHLLPSALRDKCLKLAIYESILNDSIFLQVITLLIVFINVRLLNLEKLIGDGMTHVSFCGYWQTTDELVCSVLHKCSLLQSLSLAGSHFLFFFFF